MLNLNELIIFLKSNDSSFEIIRHDNPIISTQDAAKYFDIEKAVPTFIMDTDIGLLALILSSKRGRIDFKVLKQELGFLKFKMADKVKIQKEIGYQIGAIPLVGHNLPCIFDESILEYDYIFGGSGDELHTLKIVPSDVLRLNNVIKRIFDNEN